MPASLLNRRTPEPFCVRRKAASLRDEGEGTEGHSCPSLQDRPPAPGQATGSQDGRRARSGMGRAEAGDRSRGREKAGRVWPNAFSLEKNPQTLAHVFLAKHGHSWWLTIWWANTRDLLLVAVSDLRCRNYVYPKTTICKRVYGWTLIFFFSIPETIFIFVLYFLYFYHVVNVSGW